MTPAVDHIGVAVSHAESAVELYRALGFSDIREETVPEEGVRVLLLGSGPGRVELLEPLEATGRLARFIDRHGEGLHHIAIAVENIEAALERSKSQGARPVGEIRVGAGGRRVAFLHPGSASGVLLELVETAGA